MVMVGGFLSMRPEDVALYLDSDFDRRVSAKDGIWLNVTNQAWHPFLQKCNGRYCVVVGKFTSVEKGHMSGNSGGISEVDTITVYR